MRTWTYLALASSLLCGAARAEPCAISCGTGTVAVGDQCIADPPVSCGAGAVSRAGACVPRECGPLWCGPRTEVRDGACVATKISASDCGEGTTLVGERCERSHALLSCAEELLMSTVSCEAPPEVTCGGGTALQAGACVRLKAPVSCLAGTERSGDMCVANATEVSCGSGTARVDGGCVAQAPKQCGAFTRLEESACVPSVAAIACGNGTTRVGDICVVRAKPQFAVTFLPTSVLADGYSRALLVVMGVEADGSPSRRAVDLEVSAGTLERSTFSLVSGSFQTRVTSCSHADESCRGSIAAVLRDRATREELARGTLLLRSPMPVQSMAPCGDAPEVFHVQVGPATFRATEGLTANACPRPFGGAEPVSSCVYASGGELRLSLDVGRQERPVRAQIYPVTQGRSFLEAPVFTPAMELTGPFNLACDRGSVQVHDLVFNAAGEATRLEASFEVRCSDGQVVATGCVRANR